MLVYALSVEQTDDIGFQAAGAAGRVYAACAGVQVGAAILWLSAVEDIQPTTTDWVGVAVAMLGMGIIVFGPRSS